MKKIFSILALALAFSFNAFADDVQESKLNIKIPTLIVIDTDDSESVEKAWRVAESIRANGFNVSVLTCKNAEHGIEKICSKLRSEIRAGVFVY